MKLFALTLMLAAAMLPADAAVARAVVAVPGSAQAGSFATKAVPMPLATSLTLMNGDAAYHSVIADEIGSDDAPWCGPLNPGPESPLNPRRFARGHCPLFWSDLAYPLGGSRPVLGIENLRPGRAYGFACGVHPSMEAVLIT